MRVEAAQVLEVANFQLRRLVRVYAERLGCQMAAHDRLGRWLGRSGSWVRKVLGRQPHVVIEGHQLLNLDFLHARECGPLTSNPGQTHEDIAEALGDLAELRERIRELEALVSGSASSAGP